MTTSANPFSMLSTVDLSDSRPKPIAWEEYEEWLLKEWATLLASSPAESAVQKFLEQNPSLVPSLYSVGNVHHVMQGHAVFAEPPLSGTGPDRRPDFMWIQANSNVIRPVFVEIERPDKKIFTALPADGDPTKMRFSAQFTQARNQLNQWRTWWNDPVNQLNFRTNFIDLYVEGTVRQLEPHYVLVYGRQSELRQVPGNGYLADQLKNEKKPDEEIMTYDRLWPIRAFSDFPTLMHIRPGRVSLRGVPASLTTGPLFRKLYGRVPNPSADVFNNPMWSKQRSDYVRGRWEHWAQEYLKDPKPFGDLRTGALGE